jgi:CRP-like cAMP-binding protein
VIPERISPFKNHVLASLPKGELRRLEPHLERMKLARGYMLHESAGKVGWGYFLEDGLASIVVILENGSTVEVGVMGREGMSGLPLLLGTEQIPNQAFMQVGGSGHRIKGSVLREIIEKNEAPKLRALLLRYLHLHLVQASQTAACNRLHEVDQRMARWLLICHDRVNSNDIPLTHEFLAQMLGTRRSSVTLAAGSLQRRGLIRYSRGRVTIIDQEGLEQVACECYRAIRDEQRRLGLI